MPVRSLALLTLPAAYTIHTVRNRPIAERPQIIYSSRTHSQASKNTLCPAGTGASRLRYAAYRTDTWRSVPLRSPAEPSHQGAQDDTLPVPHSAPLTQASLRFRRH